MQQSAAREALWSSSAADVFCGRSSPASMPFHFTATGREYFRIWIVNLLLTILTLGIYSAWAKVRRTRYFYDNTRLADAAFDYHGTPLAILKGRILAVLLLVAYQIALRISGTLGVAILIMLAIAAPWLIWKSLQFKLSNSGYRGIRFAFDGSAKQVYTTFLLLPLLTVLSFYLLMPLTHQRIKRFQHSESRFGMTHFSFDGKVSAFYKVYAVGLLIGVAGLLLIGIFFGGTLSAMFNAQAAGLAFGTIVLMIIALYAWVFTLFPIILTMIQNQVWNGTAIGPHRFVSNMVWKRTAWIGITNLLGIVATFGLFLPFAQVRMLRYRIESMTLIAQGGIDEFVAAQQAPVSATGEGVSDLFDFDISL